MRFQRLLAWLVLAGLVGALRMAASATAAVKPPNVVLILADDLGYGDLGVTGSRPIPTPNIASLAAGGVRFSNAYVSLSVCAPSRAGMMIGKHQAFSPAVQRYNF